MSKQSDLTHTIFTKFLSIYLEMEDEHDTCSTQRQKNRLVMEKTKKTRTSSPINVYNILET